MKKNLLAIGITAALSTIGFCGVANARIASNGTTINGLTLQGTQLQSLKVEGGQLVAVRRVEVK
ncbi:hypothetical protein IQ276_004990 [Desmonostoc muscorum LEGE 12446]|uniref:hypothetical protein n=1 Tax=Desmonostoc muscorum TaxID=1179 RepID=UPI001F40C171|nr:hypothetical protein [Desmonostoc muscorum]MCF2145825.1 hypothetical protein [Desmonostoc muscorum LEGE 12446]